jgi:class 3 adenylate cyclase/predicted ATPase
VRCSTCEADNPEGSRFCEDCGATLATVCPACGGHANPGKRFCRICGTRLDGSPSPAAAAGEVATGVVPPPAPGPLAGRRVCSVLFCDLVGFTPLSEARDPEDVRDLLSRYFDVARTVIGRYGGSVEKFIGDAVMAVWGAPVATEGDAERAVRAGLDLVAAVRALAGELVVANLSARVGVVTGEVALRADLEGEGLAGDTVNTAARVQGVADPGTVLVDHVTWQLSRSSVTFIPAGQHLLKGKSAPVTLWRADRVVSGVGGAQRVDGLEAPLLGRERELRLLKELFHGCVDRRNSRLVSITGPAGVGKSRLGWELEKYLDGLVTSVYWHHGRCLSYGDGVAFWALAEMVRARLGIAEEDPSEMAEAKLGAGLDRWLIDQAARDYIRPRLARLLGVGGGGPSLGREELFAGWRLFFEQLGSEAPVVLVFEDIHHADAGLLDFIEHLLDWARDVAIFVLTLGRPDTSDHRRAGWGARRNGTVLALEPLPDRTIAAMLEALVPGMDDQATAAVVAQAEGIPLYAVETVRMLIDRGAIEAAGDGYRLVGDVETLSVPTSLQSLIAARLDALPPEARRLVADAAVLGGSFPAEALVAVTSLSEERVRVLLDELVRREVLTVRADRLSPEQGQYAFVQTLVRQVAYDRLSRRERKARHLAVAAHLTGAFPGSGEEVSEAIAGHLLDALGALPDDPDVEPLRQQAEAALVRAGSRAVRTGAPATAERAYARAAQLREEAGTTDADLAAAALWERAGAAAWVKGDPPSTERHYRRAADLYGRHDRARDAARAITGTGESLRMQGRHEQARALLRQALAALEAEPDADTVTCLRHLATVEVFSGEPDHAHRLTEQALGLAQQLGLAGKVYIDLFIIHGIALVALHRLVEATMALREAARRAEESEESLRAARALLNLSSAVLASDPREAASAARRAVEYARRAGAAYVLSAATVNLSEALVLTGDWDEVGALLGDAPADGLDEDPYLAGMAVLLAALRGRADEVSASMQVVRERLRGTEDVQDESFRAWTEALASLAAGDPAGVLRHATDALKIGEGLGLNSDSVLWSWPLAADAALEIGDEAEAARLLDWLGSHPPGHVSPLLRAERRLTEARLLAGRPDPAPPDAFDGAVSVLREYGSPYHLAAGLIHQARFLADAGHPERAASLADEAGLLAAKLGAAPLTRLAQQLSASGVPDGRQERHLLDERPQGAEAASRS